VWGASRGELLLRDCTVYDVVFTYMVENIGTHQSGYDTFGGSFGDGFVGEFTTVRDGEKYIRMIPNDLPFATRTSAGAGIVSSDPDSRSFKDDAWDFFGGEFADLATTEVLVFPIPDFE